MRPIAVVAAFALFAATQALAASPPAKPRHAHAAPPAAAVPPMRWTYRELPNGLKVYAIRDTHTPNVAVQVWYKVGSKDDPKGRSGFAHLFEHLMFKATRNLPSESFDRLTEDVGGSNNASTNDDYTEYHEVVPANYLRPVLWAEAERMGSLVVDEAGFKSERSVVEEELRQRVLAQPYGELFYLLASEIAFDKSPYGRPGIGSIENLEAATLADVQAFHAVWYRPDNAVLVVAGDFDPKELDAWVDAYFGKLKRPAWPIPAQPPAEPRRLQTKLWNAYAPNTPLPAILYSFSQPPADSKDTAALEVADVILGRGESSRLHQSLVYRRQIAQEAFTFQEMRAQSGAYAVGVILNKGVSLEQGEAALSAEIAAMALKPPTAEELARAKRQLMTQTLLARETALGKSGELAAAVVLYGDPERVNRDVAEINQVTAADVQRVAFKYWRLSRRAEVRYQSDAVRPTNAPGHGPASTIEAPTLVAPANLETFALAPPDQRVSPPPAGAPVAFHPPTPVERTLANGLRVIVAENPQVPLVAANLLISQGAAGDPKTRPGLASMSAELLTKGAGGRSAPEIARAIESLGGALEAGAARDSSSLALTVGRGSLDRAMAIFADVARRPTFASEELERQRKQALSDLDVAMSDPSSIAGWAAARAVYAGAPYGAPIKGGPVSLAAVSSDEVRAFHHAWWRPDRATLVLTGDLTPDQGFALAQRWFGDWTSPTEAAPAVAPPSGDPPKPRVIVVDLPGAGQAAVTVTRLGLTRTDPRHYQALVANQVLGGGYSSRLNEEIRVKRGLSYGASSAFAFRLAPGPFSAATQTKNPSAPEVAQLITSTMQGMGKSPATDAELRARKSALIGEFGRQVETNGGSASVLGLLALYHIDLGELARYGDKVQAVTAEDVRAFSAQVLDPASASLVIVGDAKHFLEALRAKYPDLELIPAADFDLESPTLRKTTKR